MKKPFDLLVMFFFVCGLSTAAVVGSAYLFITTAYNDSFWAKVSLVICSILGIGILRNLRALLNAPETIHRFYYLEDIHNETTICIESAVGYNGNKKNDLLVVITVRVGNDGADIKDKGSFPCILSRNLFCNDAGMVVTVTGNQLYNKHGSGFTLIGSKESA